ncbi:DUF2842 domain-containing protein [Cognatishimia activa]|uniref:DUF2842 domain-containing protein n=1 Tax=Cognatishimia activa TaxID=1715691 RepID=A0A0P1IMZ6_9RHOB|nr:DUF2842 domain-containing protein [Cognatishimia activa]MEE2945205.1 DUF2842 domain-containing protein [Pseudomonadota bacterium]CUJ12229.1 hypothetical protein TA5113_02358 [Cognatishimia activa]CUK24922.1 hypothetical protein TA5114_00711 [Cognatishimia activa]
MALSHKAKRRWALLILVIGLPVYMILASVLATTVLGWLGRPSILLELLIYVALGVIWVFPLKKVFMGVGQAGPDEEQ